MSLAEIAQRFPHMKILKDEKLSHYTYTETGGPADVVAFPSNTEEIEAIVDYVRMNNLPLTVLGNASNLIVRDGGIRGVVIILTEMNQITATEDRVIAQGGASLIETSEFAYEQSLTGLEFACGIPGSIGGAVYMNAGAYGGEVMDVIESVTVLSRAGEVKTYSNEEMDFSYRHSLINETKDIVLEVTFLLHPGDPDVIKAKMDELTYLRTSRQPLEYPSCGSVFKRPNGYYAGKLIQDAGLQGKMWGGAQVSKKHAGFIVNLNQATATDYIELIAHIQETVYAQFGVRLETEVHVIGESPRI